MILTNIKRNMATRPMKMQSYPKISSTKIQVISSYSVMHLMRTIKLITRFYGGIFLANFLVTLSCVRMMQYAGHDAPKLLSLFFWYKSITIGLIFYTAIHYKKNELYYYQNLGISKRQLIIATSLFDFLTWVIFVVLQLRVDLPGYIFNLILWSALLTNLYAYIRK